MLCDQRLIQSNEFESLLVEYRLILVNSIIYYIPIYNGDDPVPCDFNADEPCLDPVGCYFIDEDDYYCARYGKKP